MPPWRSTFRQGISPTRSPARWSSSAPAWRSMRMRRRDVADALDALTLAPEKTFDDAEQYLALRSAYYRLMRGGQRRRSPRRGRLSLVGRARHRERRHVARRAGAPRRPGSAPQGAGERRLRRGDPRLTQALRDAMQKYLQALAEQMQRNPGQMANIAAQRPDAPLPGPAEDARPDRESGAHRQPRRRQAAPQPAAEHAREPAGRPADERRPAGPADDAVAERPRRHDPPSAGADGQDLRRQSRPEPEWRADDRARRCRRR